MTVQQSGFQTKKIDRVVQKKFYDNFVALLNLLVSTKPAEEAPATPALYLFKLLVKPEVCSDSCLLDTGGGGKS